MTNKKRSLGAMRDRGGYQQEIKALTQVLTFGKYKGWTVEDVIEIDASYIVYLNDERIARVSSRIVEIAEEAESDQRLDVEMDGDWEGIDMYGFMADSD